MKTSASYAYLVAALFIGCEHSSDATDCGPGTTLSGNQCVVAPTPDAPDLTYPTGERYGIRIAESTLGANGHTKRRVLAFGTNADGTPLLEPVVVGVDRASAGSFTKTALTLGVLGAETYFTPCDQAVAGCLGPATLTLALASAPSVPVAQVDIDLVTPTTVSTIAPCKIGGNVLYVDGNRVILDRISLITEATWRRDMYPSPPNEVQINVGPTDPIQGTDWTLEFDTIQLGTPLGIRSYTNAERFHFATAGHPGLSVRGGGTGCTTRDGAFQLHAFDAMAVTISFAFKCVGLPDDVVVEGCVHVGP